jgi:hypothetical protein
MNGISYDVRIWAIETYRGAKVTTYTVRWKVGPKRWRRSFRIIAQADSFRAELLAAARRGEAFAIETGLPASWRRDNLAVSWYDFTCSYMDMKWKLASAKYRRAIAQALAAALPAMVKPSAGKPSDPDIRRAVLGWGTTPGFARQHPLTWRPYSSGYRAIPGQCQTWAAQPMPAPC